MKRKKPELLAPAGNMEKLKMAFLYGADAVYLGGEAYGLRAQGGNFSREELAEAARFAHERGKRIYVTVNVYPHNEEFSALPTYLRYLQSIGADAFRGTAWLESADELLICGDVIAIEHAHGIVVKRRRCQALPHCRDGLVELRRQRAEQL